uniref:CLIP-associating protein 2 n=2 Tax=Cacopsylla melanoneura TaxID=428564 RepID=A0A8D8ZYB3_9HEMI
MKFLYCIPGLHRAYLDQIVGAPATVIIEKEPVLALTEVPILYSRSTQSLSRTDSVGPSNSYHRKGSGGTNSSSSSVKPVTPQPRSSSAIDLQAVQRAKVRAEYAARARQKISSGTGVAGSLPRSRKNSITELTPERDTRTSRHRSTTRGSMSTPTSRSGSPSSRFSYTSYSPQLTGRTRRSSGIPRSTDTSRESSPNRHRSYRTGSVGPVGGRPPIQPLNRSVMASKILQQSREAESAFAEALDSPEMSRNILSKRSFLADAHSDESETSSLCSERSFDSYRRTSDTYSSWNGSQNRIYRDICESTPKDIGEIISNCESTHWNDRKDGLVNLQCYLQAGNLLSPFDLKRITEIFTKMFMDSHTKVFSLFLDCFNELIVTHHNDLHSWLYLLITRLLNKQGADLLGSVHTKILKSLEVVRECFPPHLQLGCAFRFLTDPTQTPNTKVKLATLSFITKLATITDPSLAFPLPKQGEKDFATLALSKLIGWTMGEHIKQGTELRKAAQDTILALFNLNTPQITFRFSLLPKEYQEAAATLITTRVRKSSAPHPHDSPGPGAGNNNGYSSLPSSPRLGSPGHYSTPPPLSLENSENLNPDEIYKSLRRTTAEIHKFSGGERDDSISYDSGISQMSAPGLDERERDTHLRERHDNNDKDTFTLQRLLDQLKETERKPVGDRKQLLSKLHECVQVNTNSISVHFKGLLYQLLSLSEDEEPQIREYSITILNSLVKKPAIVHLFGNYIELVVLKVINRSKDTNKDVYKACENCALSLAVHLPSEKVTRILFPLIVAEEHPINLIAIKMMTKVIELNGKSPVESFLPNIMPALLQAYENQDSCVRKCAVFCMVALYKEFGDHVLSPYINKLSGAKLKLLQLYIKRSQTHSSSVPTSPKSNM